MPQNPLKGKQEMNDTTVFPLQEESESKIIQFLFIPLEFLMKNGVMDRYAEQNDFSP